MKINPRRTEQDGFGRAAERRNLIEPFAEGDIGLIGNDLDGGVRVGSELSLDGSDDRRMPMSRVQDGYAASEIDVPTAVDVPELGVFRAGGKDRECGCEPARKRSGTAGLK